MFYELSLNVDLLQFFTFKSIKKLFIYTSLAFEHSLRYLYKRVNGYQARENQPNSVLNFVKMSDPWFLIFLSCF